MGMHIIVLAVSILIFIIIYFHNKIISYGVTEATFKYQGITNSGYVICGIRVLGEPKIHTVNIGPGMVTRAIFRTKDEAEKYLKLYLSEGAITYYNAPFTELCN